MKKHLIRELLVNSGLMAVIAVAWYYLGFGWWWIVAPVWIPIVRDLQAILHKKLKIKEDEGPGTGYKS
jgi:hypothetical protein